MPALARLRAAPGGGAAAVRGGGEEKGEEGGVQLSGGAVSFKGAMLQVGGPAAMRCWGRRCAFVKRWSHASDSALGEEGM